MMTLKKIPFHEWGNVLGLKIENDYIELLYSPVISDAPIDVPDNEKELILRKTPTSPYREAYECVLDNYISMGEFTYELYLAMPYFVEIYQTWKQKQDFQWQFLFLALIGNCLSTDFPRNHFSKRLNETMPKEIIETHLRSIEIIREEAKEFVTVHLERLKQLNLDDAEEFCLCLLAILGDREASYVLFTGSFDRCFFACPHCTNPDEDYDIDYYFDWYVGEKPACSLGEEIQPAPYVIGQWDQKSYDNDYIWMSNLLYLLGSKDGAKKMSFYYGTFICPNCGKKGGTIMDLAKQRMILNEESIYE